MMQRVTAAVLSLLVGSTLLYLGVPRTVAAFALLPGNHALKAIQQRNPVSDRERAVFAASRERALSWVEAGRMWTDLALVQLLEAAAEREAGKPRSELIDGAIASLRSGLMLAPARPHAWTRLAYAELLSGKPARAVVPALRMALLTATYEPGLLFVRLELCLIAWRYFERDGRALIFKQVRLAWRDSPDRLVALAQRSGGLGIIRASLAHSPSDLAEFEKRFQRSGA